MTHNGWIRFCSHCCRRYHFIFVYVQWTMKIKWYPLQQWLQKRIHPSISTLHASAHPSKNGLKWTEMDFVLFVSNPDSDLLNSFLCN